MKSDEASGRQDRPVEATVGPATHCANCGWPAQSCDCDESYDDEPSCLICGGEGWVDGSDHLDWDEDGYDDIIRCTSCKGSGLAKDMTWC
ncbi:MAG: hypothetical protein AB1651_16795 [Pseudomonadota bacterium]